MINTMTVTAALADPAGSLEPWIAGCFFVLGIRNHIESSYTLVDARCHQSVGSVRSLVSIGLRRILFLIPNRKYVIPIWPFSTKIFTSAMFPRNHYSTLFNKYFKAVCLKLVGQELHTIYSILTERECHFLYFSLYLQFKLVWHCSYKFSMTCTN